MHLPISFQQCGDASAGPCHLANVLLDHAHLVKVHAGQALDLVHQLWSNFRIYHFFFFWKRTGDRFLYWCVLYIFSMIKWTAVEVSIWILHYKSYSASWMTVGNGELIETLTSVVFSDSAMRCCEEGRTDFFVCHGCRLPPWLLASFLYFSSFGVSLLVVSCNKFASLEV